MTKILKSRRRCFICDSDVQMSQYKTHIENHSEDLPHFKFSNNLADYTKTACKICGKEATLSQMRVHTKGKHGMQIYEYRSKFNQHNFDIIERVFHQCRICEKIILLDSDRVASHLHSHKGDHKLTQKEYNEKFMIKIRDQKNSKVFMTKSSPNHESSNYPKKTISVIANTSDSPNMVAVTPNVAAMEVATEVVEDLLEHVFQSSGVMEDIPGRVMEQPPRMKKKTDFISRIHVNLTRRCFICDFDIKSSEYEAHLHNHSEDIKTLKISNNLTEYCKTACKVCGNIFNLNGMTGHIKNEHGMVPTEYKKRYKQHYFDLIEKVFHRCGICRDIILLDKDSITHHLQSHKGEQRMTRKQYNNEFMVRKKIPKFISKFKTKSPPKFVSSKSPKKMIPAAPNTPDSSFIKALFDVSAMEKEIQEAVEAMEKFTDPIGMVGQMQGRWKEHTPELLGETHRFLGSSPGPIEDILTHSENTAGLFGEEPRMMNAMLLDMDSSSEKTIVDIVKDSVVGTDVTVV